MNWKLIVLGGLAYFVTTFIVGFGTGGRDPRRYPEGTPTRRPQSSGCRSWPRIHRTWRR